jgi:hypothetical protein
MGAKHTPGPYEADALPFHRESWAELNDGKPLNIVKRGADVLAVVWCADDDNETQEAQAVLFASAPDLLEALTDCLAALTDPVVGTIYGDDPDWYRKVDDAANKARAAIAKATGEA